jgi:hypothetical protein
VTWQTEELFAAATDLLDRESRRLRTLGQIESQQPDAFDRDGVFSMSRALTYVICGGILENLMRDLPRAVSDDIMSLRLQRSRVPSSFLAVLSSTTFQRCNTKSTKTLISRATLLTEVFNHANDIRPLSAFYEDLPLADGSTITTTQFEAIWLIFELPNSWQNTPNDTLMLRELTRKRNEVAHWEADPVDVGKTRTTSDLLKITSQLRALLDHVALNVCEWLDQLPSRQAAAIK